MSDLAKLKNYRDQILLAELVGWLHDYRKCSDEQLQVQSKNPSNNATGLPRDNLIIRFPSIVNASLSLPYDSATLDRLLNDRKRWNSPILGQYLGRCHNTAHIDKQEPPRGEGEQDHNIVFLSSVFGYESTKNKVPSDLTNRLFSSIRWNDIIQFQGSDRDEFYANVKELFSQCGADTRRPINEITLWSWGHTVGSLYKAAIAGALFGFRPPQHDLQWRLISIRLDGLEFFFQSAHLPDLLARRNMLVKVFDEIRELMEVSYPLGSEVYRDENGSVFIVPGCEKGNCILNLLAIQDSGKTLRQHILDKVFSVIEDEIIPNILVDSEPWWGQDPDWKYKIDQNIFPNDVPPPIPEHLKTTSAGPLPEWVSRQWRIKEQICTVCGLRPQGYGAVDMQQHYQRISRIEKCPEECQTCKAISRGVCSICEQRRDDRSMKWATKKLSTTIWIDEIADTNARLALLVGYFDLQHWLSGDSVRTLAICNPANAMRKEADKVAKNPSFARLRRIWETTRAFWQYVYPNDFNNANVEDEAVMIEEEAHKLKMSIIGKTIGQAKSRLEIRGILKPRTEGHTLGSYHACDIILSKGARMSVVWDPEFNRFITADNLDYLSGKDQLGQCLEDVLRELAQKKSILTIEEPTGYGSKNKIWGTLSLDPDSIKRNDIEYTPALPILAEPRTFMALVPAYKALDVVNKIKAKYEREMGKVRNRLPLHLGIVYAHRRTPLRAILDAGRRMLDQKYIGDVGAWTVTDNVTEQSDMLPHKAAYLSEDSSQFTKWYPVCLKHQEMNRELVWYVPAVMGDGTTPDNWYPYVFWSRDSDGNTEPANATVPRSRYFQSPNPWKKEDSSEPGWLVHAGELKVGDLIYFTPATLDFQWLDSAGRRFEIAYDERGQRFSTPRRPYLLDEIESLNRIWQTLSSHLTKNQIYILRDLIETKRTEWQIVDQKTVDDSVFKEFCRVAIVNAEWKNGELPWEAEGKDRKEWLDQWADYAVRGWITDAIELHLQIMKEEVQDEF